MDFDALRDRMVRTQIEARGIRDTRVLGAMREVPRHLFVCAGYEAAAYDDRPLPIGLGQTISQPFMVAAMTEALHPADGHRVLEVGTGSGYQAAVLGRLVREVITVERHEALAEQARKSLAAAGVENVRVVVGDGSEGLPDDAPFDGILVTAGAPTVPDSLKMQLSDGGRLVIPVGAADHQVVTAVTRYGNQFLTETGEACVFVPLLGKFGWHA
ncbi:MAG TPA: protein-L-isoaspartate(D-aspartate) O-methyltransferase [Vicinamibacterales bacterium]|nr:protein-L-isoaspartate(D-aspartate) O-methyltransferase [Vicinamibacterales bacterium]